MNLLDSWLSPNLVISLFVFMVFVIMGWNHRLPEPWAVKQYISALNDRGGNIVVLVIMTVWFFSVSVKIFYYAFDLLSQKRLDADNAILLMAVQFVTSSAFGGSFGALLKTMTGSDSMARGTDSRGPGTSSTSTSTTTSTTNEPPSTTVRSSNAATRDPSHP